MADFCLRCGRALKNKSSIKRGYGPGCYKKINREEKKDKESQVDVNKEERIEIEGQIFIDELEERRSMRKIS
ncbi:DUF6011 domain-containing protein [Wansuia hejianensis]|uniref:Uncharacterized protein n=1 Tax=Wansuia hejianensis TaxID=2763667 RepID=A0A926F2A9_9FIRM|nr:DUF6011 domain-containing protein [Wansuia hejianensis]MBC8590644.1 hypothetical protein [Wansuia hejianensis]